MLYDIAFRERLYFGEFHYNFVVELDPKEFPSSNPF